MTNQPTLLDPYIDAYLIAWTRFMQARGFRSLAAAYRVGVAYRKLVSVRTYLTSI